MKPTKGRTARHRSLLGGFERGKGQRGKALAMVEAKERRAGTELRRRPLVELHIWGPWGGGRTREPSGCSKPPSLSPPEADDPPAAAAPAAQSGARPHWAAFRGAWLR